MEVVEGDGVQPGRRGALPACCGKFCRRNDGAAPDALHGPAVVGPDGIHPLDAGQTGHDGTGVDIQRQQRCGDQIVLLLVAGLGAGVQHHGQQRTDRQHDSGDREQEGRLANGHSLRPPSQQPERDDEDGEQENVAGQFKDRAQRCTPKA